MYGQISCTQPQFQPIAWTAQTVPQLHMLQQQLPQGLHQFIAPLTSAVLNLVTHEFNRHAGRMFLFNQMYSNNFASNELLGTVYNAISILSIFINSNQVNSTNVSQYIGAAADIAVEIQAASNILNPQNGMLQQALGNVGIAGAQQVFQKHSALINQIQQNKQRQMHQPGMLDIQQPNTFSGGLGVNNSIQQFSGSDAYSRAGDGFVSSAIGSDDELTKILLDGTPRPMQQSTYQAFDAGFTNVTQPVNIEWVTTPNQFHPPAYNGLTHMCELRQYKTDNIYYLPEKKVDIKQHITGQPLSTASVIVDETLFQTKIDKLEYTVVNKVNPNEGIPNWMKSEQIIDGPDLNYIVNAANIHAAIANHGSLPDGCAYTIEGYIVEPIVSAPDMSELMDFIYNATEFTEIADHLRYVLKDGNNKGVAAFIEILNNRLTDCVNKVFTDCLSISPKQLMITNFIDDIGQVKTHLNHNYGIKVLSAYEQSQASALRRMFTGDYESITEALEEIKHQYIGTYENTKDMTHGININFFAQNVYLTVVNLNSKEINLELSEKDVANLVGTETGPIGRFMDYVLGKIIEKENINSKMLNYRVIFVTQDRKLFEVFLSPYERAFTVKQITE